VGGTGEGGLEEVLLTETTKARYAKVRWGGRKKGKKGVVHLTDSK